VKRILVVAVLVLLAAQAQAQTSNSAAPDQATPAGVPIIGVVDIQRVVHESSAGKSLDAQYDKQHQLFTDQVADKERELANREDDLKRQRTILTPDSFNAQREALESYAAEAQKTIQEQSQANQLAFNDAFAQLVKVVREIVATVAKEKGIVVVLPQEQTLYIGPGAIDMTSIVLNRLEVKMPDVPVNLPSANAKLSGTIPATP
jgi:Skp family chaperone for outer membrane proteins